MKWLISISMTTFLVLFVSGTAVAQSDTTTTPAIERQIVGKVIGSKTLPVHPEIVLHRPYRNRINNPGWFRQAGAFYGTYGWGFEYTMRPENSRMYGSLFISNMPNPDRRIPDTRYLAMAGLTIGYEVPLHHINLPGIPKEDEILRAVVDGTQLYVRFGPGIGVAGVRRQNGESELHPGVHALTAIGALRRVTRRTSFFIEAGGRLAWFPTLVEMHFVAGPDLSIGFLIFPQGQISPYQF